MDWIKGMQNAIRYIEDNITEKLDYGEIAKMAYVSSFHFQRIFSLLCGYSIGEYVRRRRLTLAGEELSASDTKIIDTALKYGYDSPDSFAKAFVRFHGIPPSSAKIKGANLKSFAPLRIKFILEGGSIMEYKIVEKEAFTVIGVMREFNTETSYAEIPKFWCEHYQTEACKYISGMYGICIESKKDEKLFDYLIADNYNPCMDIPEGCVTKIIPAHTWAIFPCRGAMPKALQDVNTRIWSEWLPNCREYELADNCNIEMYTHGDTQSGDYYSEIWIPVKKV